MEIPSDVLIHNELLGLKGSKGTLVAVSPHGYFEAKLRLGKGTHRVLLPIAETVIIFRERELETPTDLEIER